MEKEAEKLIHGGDIYSHRPGNKPLLDFSANINPLGMPPQVRQALVAHIDDYTCYPDPLCRELRKGLAQFHSIQQDWILCGNGAADIIFRLCYGLRPQKALVLAPTFAEYEQALRAVRCQIEYAALNKESDFKINITALCEAVQPDIDMVFLCNPNNPTGIAINREELQHVIKRCADCGAILVIDECFADFLEQEELYSVIPLAAGSKNLVILRAFTKMYAMAGIRLGYMISSNQAILSAVEAAGQPWSVSGVASRCGITALSCTAHVTTTKSYIAKEREWLRQELSALGMQVVPSQVNFLLFRSPFSELAQKLELQGVLIRSCGNYHGLTGDYFRIAVKSREENRRLIAAMRLCQS